MRHRTCNENAGVEMAHKQSFQMITEMKEFATFSGAEQRFIRRSLDVASRGTSAGDQWSRHDGERASIEAQAKLYRGTLAALHEIIPDDLEINAASAFITQLALLSASDLGEGKLASFAAYRFLYERLLGGAVRPWLPSAFLSAAAMPHVNPAVRKVLLRSITESDVLAAGWSSRAAAFTPEWVDKVPVAVS
jgi:hypothetical protein